MSQSQSFIPGKAMKPNTQRKIVPRVERDPVLSVNCGLLQLDAIVLPWCNCEGTSVFRVLGEKQNRKRNGLVKPGKQSLRGFPVTVLIDFVIESIARTEGKQ